MENRSQSDNPVSALPAINYILGGPDDDQYQSK